MPDVFLVCHPTKVRGGAIGFVPVVVVYFWLVVWVWHMFYCDQSVQLGPPPFSFCVG